MAYRYRGLILPAAAFVAAVGAPFPASACRTIVPDAARLARHDVAVVVTIRTAERLKKPGWNSWRLTARRLTVAAGATGREEYSFITTQSSDGCGITDLPAVGATWVVYQDGSGQGQVAEAFPLPLARLHDPRLANIP